MALLFGLEHGGSPVTRRSAKDLFAFESSAFRSPSAGECGEYARQATAGDTVLATQGGTLVEGEEGAPGDSRRQQATPGDTVL